jgi:hypothetical protein
LSPLRRARLLVLVAACGAAAPQPAFAQSSRDRAAARSAADAGADAYEQGHYERSLELFTKAEQLLHAPPHLLYMARSFEKLGRLVEAREAYLKIINEQLPANAPPAFKAAHAQADTELSNVEGRIAYVTVIVQGTDAKQAVVTLDHTDLPVAEADIPIPTDPGTHVFSAHTSRTKTNEVSVTLRDGAKQTVNLLLPDAPADAPPVGDNPPPLDGGGKGQPPRKDRPATSRGTSGQAVAGYVGLGVGAVGIGLGTYFIISSTNTRNKATAEFACDMQQPNGCSDPQIADIRAKDKDADKTRALSIVSYSVGGAAAITGLVLLLTDHPSTAEEEQPPSGEPFGSLRILPGLGSITVTGKF